MYNKLRLGYSDSNKTLGIEFHADEGLEFAKKNIILLKQVLKWNIENGIRFFRLPNILIPGATNYRKIKRAIDWTAFAYDFSSLAPQLREIGDYARQHDHRLSFHAPFFVVLTSYKPFVIATSYRELNLYAKIFEMMGYFGTVTLHLGTFFTTKQEAIAQFVKNYNKLPKQVRSHIIIENDETTFNINDVLETSRLAHIPVCFDYFHYFVYNLYHRENPKKYDKQMELGKAIKLALESWNGARPKFHLSEQREGFNRGAHSDYIENIPDELADLDIDLMLESRERDKNVLKIRNDKPPN
jgi:UV DNA damage endonuclease